MGVADAISAEDLTGLTNGAMAAFTAARMLVLPPAESNHVKGTALDVRPHESARWLEEHGAAYGLCQIYRNEPRHDELRPQALDDGSPPCTATLRTIHVGARSAPTSPGGEEPLLTRLSTTTWVLGITVSAILAAGWLVHSGAQAQPPSLPSSRPPRITSAQSSAQPLALPWPSRGQAAVEITGQADSLSVHGKQRPVPIASITKVMTALVILRDHPLGRNASGPSVRVDRQAAIESGNRDESTVPITAGQSFTERQLLELMLIPSGNNAARLLARWDAGSERAFVSKMNAAAAKLGMKNTTYTGASGYEPTTVSTAVDQLKLAKQAMKDPVLRDIFTTTKITIPSVTGEIVNTNKLLGLPGVVGLKTGTSTAAGGALLWAVRPTSGNRDRLILGVVLRQGDPDDTLEEKKEAAFVASRRLIAAAQQQSNRRSAR